MFMEFWFLDLSVKTNDFIAYAVKGSRGGFHFVLVFQLENLFCLGSPLGVFLALRGIRPQGKGSLDHIIPDGACKRLFNVYHPADPVVRELLISGGNISFTPGIPKFCHGQKFLSDSGCLV